MPYIPVKAFEVRIGGGHIVNVGLLLRKYSIYNHCVLNTM